MYVCSVTHHLVVSPPHFIDIHSPAPLQSRSPPAARTTMCYGRAATPKGRTCRACSPSSASTTLPVPQSSPARTGSQEMFSACRRPRGPNTLTFCQRRSFYQRSTLGSLLATWKSMGYGLWSRLHHREAEESTLSTMYVYGWVYCATVWWWIDLTLCWCPCSPCGQKHL